MDVMSGVFVFVVIVLLITAIPVFASSFPAVTQFRSWVMQVLAVAGARGILLGVALGTVATGIRILMGADRPYGG